MPNFVVSIMKSFLQNMELALLTDREENDARRKF